MTVAAYRDSADWLRDGVQTGHLVADSLDELHAVAARLGLPCACFQGDALTPHYQLPESLHATADAMGVIALARSAFAQRIARINASLRGPEPEPRRRRKTKRVARPASRRDTAAPAVEPLQQSLL